MNLPLLEPLSSPYEIWNTRQPTAEEIIAQGNTRNINVTLIETITDAKSAATHVSKNYNNNNGLSNHIRKALEISQIYKYWQKTMPSKTPSAISEYQKKYNSCDFDKVSKEIEQYGRYLSSGQKLFHGGLWKGGCYMMTDRPFSTSLCPQVALSNALWKGKAYDADRLDLFVLNVVDPAPKAFVFKNKNTKLCHELEVLLTSSLCLTLQSDITICSEYPVCKYNCYDKTIPIHILEVNVSYIV
jgi:hypothetical protein